MGEARKIAARDESGATDSLTPPETEQILKHNHFGAPLPWQQGPIPLVLVAGAKLNEIWMIADFAKDVDSGEKLPLAIENISHNLDWVHGTIWKR